MEAPVHTVTVFVTPLHSTTRNMGWLLKASNPSSERVFDTPRSVRIREFIKTHLPFTSEDALADYVAGERAVGEWLELGTVSLESDYRPVSAVLDGSF
jgi:hypothetical protein